MWPFKKSPEPAKPSTDKVHDRRVVEGDALVTYRWKPVHGEWQWVFKGSEPLKQDWGEDA